MNFARLTSCTVKRSMLRYTAHRISDNGTHSVGVTRQYCGQLGKQDNCQVAVSLSLASVQASLPIAYQLYLPKDWAADPARRKKAGVPKRMAFATKPEIALEHMRQAIAAGVPMGVALADAGYGDDTDFRGSSTELGMLYAVGIRPGTYRMGTGNRTTAAQALERTRHTIDPIAPGTGA